MEGARRPEPAIAPGRRIVGARTRARLTGGGTDGNEHLTAITGAILIVLLAVIGLTILRIHQLISVHLFVGVLLIGPVALKLGSAGYRFVRYYTRNPAYRRKGPPETVLRLIAPVVVLSTMSVFVSGLALLLVGPSGRGPLVLIHKASFIVWIACMSVHVLGHLPAMPASLRAARRTAAELPDVAHGSAGRALAVAGALLGGLVLAIALIPDFAAWTAHGAFIHHGH